MIELAVLVFSKVAEPPVETVKSQGWQKVCFFLCGKPKFAYVFWESEVEQKNMAFIGYQVFDIPDIHHVELVGIHIRL
jgi:hypothetical protein